VTFKVQDRITWNNDIVKLEEEAMIAADRVAIEYAKWGEAEKEYRIAKNISYTKYRAKGLPQGDCNENASRDSAQAKSNALACEGLAKSALEAARTARTRVSSAQSRLGAWREEMNLAKTGPMT
jgi:hypothetical protein